jgi:hypothetical protein
LGRLTPSNAGRHGRRGRRPFASRPLRKRFLIVCEGAVTEVRYFEAFPVSREVHVVVRGEGKNTTSLVAAAVEHADRASDPFDEVWVVYDHDDFGSQRFNQAEKDVRDLDGRRPEAWHAAWSNQAFEVWYVLHFQFFDAELHRHLVQAKLGELLRAHCRRTDGYAKNDPRMYDLLLPYQSQAIEHAKRLAMAHEVAPFGDAPPADADPCTTVFLLVEALNAEIH